MNDVGKVAILMGMYNGSAYILEQLRSLANQTHSNWRLIVSDDGSTDDSIQIVQEFAKQFNDHQIDIVYGPRKGFAANYRYLLEIAPKDVEFVAFSDQDDFWLPTKLERAVGKLQECSGSAMICGRTTTADEDLQPIGTSPLFDRKPQFTNALVQSIGGGNTMMFNRDALELLHIAIPYAEQIVSHDWWCYQILSGMGATIIYDQVPLILYRQHGDNLVGANTSIKARINRLHLLFKGRFKEWSSNTVSCISPIREHLTAENRAAFSNFEKARGSGLLHRFILMRKSGINRQTTLGQYALWMAVLLKLI